MVQGFSVDRYRLLFLDGEVSYLRKFMGLMIENLFYIVLQNFQVYVIVIVLYLGL